jgi:hypothetical protein
MTRIRQHQWWWLTRSMTTRNPRSGDVTTESAGADPQCSSCDVRRTARPGSRLSLGPKRSSASRTRRATSCRMREIRKSRRRVEHRPAEAAVMPRILVSIYALTSHGTAYRISAQLSVIAPGQSWCPRGGSYSIYKQIPPGGAGDLIAGGCVSAPSASKCELISVWWGSPTAPIRP